MTRQPAWTDAHGLTHFRDAHGQVGHHKPGVTCRCGPQMVPQEPTDAPQTARDAQGGSVVTGAARGRETANPAPVVGLYGAEWWAGRGQ